MSGIVEIRDYTIDPARFAAYKEWAIKLAAPWLKENLDVIDFWMDDDMEPEVAGSNPLVSENGQPNVTWIIRWPDKDTREAEFDTRMGHAEWQEIWAQHPCPDGYLHMNARFMRAAG
tara:strand:- start:803 stop:1153 length:351 start_codon:yes stop_codon:yes gene_type:complete